MDGRQSQGRVLLIANCFGEADTGAFRWNEMARHLAASGWDFDVITRNEASNDLDGIFDRRRQGGRLGEMLAGLAPTRADA